MTVDPRGRSCLSELDFTGCEIHHLLNLVSTRTRCAFERAAADQGAASTFLGPGDTHAGVREPVADTARASGRKPLTDIACCHLGDARNNMGNSLLAMGTLLGMDVRIAAPSRLWPDPVPVADCRARAEVWGERIEMGVPPAEGWGRIDLLLPCRDVLHNYGPDALEVTDAVFSSPASIVFDQAENRLHTAKAVLVATLED